MLISVYIVRDTMSENCKIMNHTKIEIKSSLWRDKTVNKYRFRDDPDIEITKQGFKNKWLCVKWSNMEKVETCYSRLIILAKRWEV